LSKGFSVKPWRACRPRWLASLRCALLAFGMMLPAVLLASAFVAPGRIHVPAQSSVAPQIAMSAPPSPPPAIDLRNPNAKPPADANAKYGHDPRDGLSPEDTAPDASFAVSSGDVGAIGTVGQLQAAIDASGDSQLVVIKFIRDGCLACAATASLYRETAKAYGGAGQFYEVNFDQSKAFCRTAGVKFVPSGHIYAKGKLQHALPLGQKAWSAFANELKASRDQL